MVPRKVIIDTDPGVDDVLAMLLAFAALPEELEVLMISVTYGNVEVQNCLRNVVSLFHVLSKELVWRQTHNLGESFSGLRHRKPIVAVGASQPLDNQMVMADYFHGRDGLGGASTTHPEHHPPSETWSHLFDQPPAETLLTATAKEATHEEEGDAGLSQPHLFTPSPAPAHLEILRLLRENPENTITIIAIGPLTNCALAAAEDPTTFLRAKELLVMAGAVDVPGNITPVAEFNFLADPLAAARVLSLTSPNPSGFTTHPTANCLAAADPVVTSYNSAHILSERRPPKRLRNLKLFPLDITTTHTLSASQFHSTVAPLRAKGSPLAEWTSAILNPTFQKAIDLHEEGTYHEGEGISRQGGDLSLHDPMCVWYALTASSEEDQDADADADGWRMTKEEDIRIETAGQWTRGMCVVDRRGRKMQVEGQVERLGMGGGSEEGEGKEGKGEAEGGDEGGWLSGKKGNRVKRCVGTPGEGKLAEVLLQRIFG